MQSMTARDGSVLAYRAEGAGLPTVLVHGGFLDSRAWLGLLPLLAPTRRVLAPDRRGHGASEAYRTGYRLEDDVEDLISFVREIDHDDCGVEVVAHSAGCHVALAAASAGAPINRLVLFEPPTYRQPVIASSVWERMDGAAGSGDREQLVRLALNDVVGASTGVALPTPAFEAIFATPFGQMLLDNALSIPAELRAYENYTWHDEALQAVRTPILLLIGADSPPFNRLFADRIARATPSAELRVLARAHHGTPIEDPARLASLIEDTR